MSPAQQGPFTIFSLYINVTNICIYIQTYLRIYIEQSLRDMDASFYLYSIVIFQTWMKIIFTWIPWDLVAGYSCLYIQMCKIMCLGGRQDRENKSLKYSWKRCVGVGNLNEVSLIIFGVLVWILYNTWCMIIKYLYCIFNKLLEFIC